MHFKLLLSTLFLQTIACLRVSVYYEALCYDSVQFIAAQLYPNYAKLSPYIDLELIPYGKAMHEKVNGKWVFDCQHGKRECLANKYQACALSLNRTESDQMNLINCIMRNRNPASTTGIEKCAAKFNFDFDFMKNCSGNDLGAELLAQNGNKTWSLDPNLSFVPTIIYNDVYDSVSQFWSLQDFPAVVCSKINQTELDVCRSAAERNKHTTTTYF